MIAMPKSYSSVNKPTPEADTSAGVKDDVVDSISANVSNKTRIIIIVCGIVLMLAALGGGVFIVLGSGLLSSGSNSSDVSTEAVVDTVDADDGMNYDDVELGEGVTMMVTDSNGETVTYRNENGVTERVTDNEG